MIKDSDVLVFSGFLCARLVVKCPASCCRGLAIQQGAFEPLEGTAVADHVWSDADERPAVERCLVVFLAILFKAFGVGVSFAVTGIGLHPDATFDLAGHQM